MPSININGEARAALQRAQPIAHVARDILEPGQASLVANRVHRLRAACGLSPCHAHRLVRVVAATPRGIRHQLKVQPKLLRQVVVPSTWTQRRRETMNPFTKDTSSVSLLFELHSMMEQRVDEDPCRIEVRTFGAHQFLPHSDERLPLVARQRSSSGRGLGRDPLGSGPE